MRFVPAVLTAAVLLGGGGRCGGRGSDVDEVFGGGVMPTTEGVADDEKGKKKVMTPFGE